MSLLNIVSNGSDTTGIYLGNIMGFDTKFKKPAFVYLL